MGNVWIPQNRNLATYQTIRGDTLRQRARVPNFHPAREHLYHHSTPEVRIVSVRKGVYQAFAQSLIGVQTSVFSRQRLGRKHASAGRVAPDECKYLIQDRDQRSLKVLEIAVSIVRLVCGESSASHTRLRVSLCWTFAKKHIAAIGQPTVLHKTQPLQRLRCVRRGIGP